MSKIDLSALLDLQAIEKEQARRSLHAFMKQAWPVVEPGTEFMDNWHISAIALHLEAVTNGSIRNLLINIPPRHAKSLLVSVFWPCWVWTFNPYLRWMFASYALNLAIGDSLKCRRLLMSDWYQERYKDVFHLSKDNNLKSRFDNDKRGARLAVSVGSAVTGYGADILCCDDPHNVVDAESQAIREHTLDWWSTAMSSRLNNPKTGAKVIVMQRVHSKDLSGYVLEQGGYTHLNLPMEYEPDRKCITYIGKTKWEDPRTQEGELLWKSRFTQQSVENFKRSMGSYAYVGQYQQRPVPAAGGLFQKSWIRYYKRGDSYYELETATGVRRVMSNTCRRILTGDVAISEKESADYTVFAVWAISPVHDIILLDLFRDRIDNPTQQKQLRTLYQKWEVDYAIVESVAYQLALIQQLRREGLAIREYKPGRGDKTTRATTPAVMMEAEKFFYDKHAPYLNDVESEILMFPKGAHDDIVDNHTIVANEVALPTSDTGPTYLYDEDDDDELML